MNSFFSTQKQVSSIPYELDGIVVVDKPPKISSAKTVAFVKRLLNARKVGHAGTLDPFARGVLICCVNNATKLARFLLKGHKKYEATLKLGEETDTQDSTGTVVAVNKAVDFSEKAIRVVVKKFEGTIEQFPPVYSALKHKGTALYKLARKGTPVQKPSRRVQISYIKLIDIKLPFIRFEVSCSAGTYIRTLCADIGKSLGCGGYLQSLKRTESSGFTIQQAVSPAALEKLVLHGKFDTLMISMSDALQEMPAYVADETLMEKIGHGKMITKRDLIASQIFDQRGNSQSKIKIVNASNKLLAILNHQKGTNRLDYCCVFPN